MTGLDRTPPTKVGEDRNPPTNVGEDLNPPTNVGEDLNPPTNVGEDLNTIEYPSGKLAAITRKKNEIVTLLTVTHPANAQHVKQLLAVYNEKVDNFLEACKVQCDKQGIPKNEESAFALYYNKHYGDIELFKHEINNWLQNESEQITPQDSVSNVGSQAGNSRTSRTSMRSSSSSLRAKLAEKRAQRLADESVIHHQKQLEQIKHEQRQSKIDEEYRQNQHKIEEERKNVEYEEKRQALERKRSLRFEENLQKEIDAIDGFSQSGAGHRSVAPSIVFRSSDNFNKVQDLPKFEPLPVPVDNNPAAVSLSNDSFVEILSKQNEISLMLLRSQERASLPKNEPECFDGSDLTKYESFIQSFKGMIEKHCDRDLDKLYYLEKYTAGLPLQLVRSCRGGDPSVGYKTALRLLKEEFGNQYNIANAYVKKIENWPPIKSEDGLSMRQLAIFLISCVNMMGDMTSLNQLNSPQEIMKVVHKLPFKYRDKWRHYTFKLIKNDKIVTFQDLSLFIQEQSSILNQPLFGDINDHNEGRLTTRAPTTHKKKSFSTFIQGTKNENKADLKIDKSKECNYCKKSNHNLGKCFFFVKIKHEDKIKFIKENKLCFACFGTGHISKVCTQRLKCAKCNKGHPTSLHLDQPENVKQPDEPTVEKIEKDQIGLNKVTSCATKSASVINHNGAGGRTVCAAVPVKIRVKGSNKFITTYMGMDNYSSDCFMNQKLLKQLGVRGAEVCISLTTMEKKDTNTRTQVLNNLEVCDLHENEKVLIPVIYCKSNWPFVKEDSPSPDDINGFPYLKDVPFEYLDAEIGLLVGINVPEIVKPIKIIDGQLDGPYATLHKMGWAFNGVVDNPSTMSSKTCYLIKIEERGNLDAMLESLCIQDFRDGHGSSTGLSIEDHRWQQKVQDSLQKQDDGHYQVDLPFKDDCVSLPCNRSQALGRLLSCKRRLKSNKEFYTDYKSFMDSMFQMGFAESVPSSNQTTELGKVWYLTHHGIYHKRKKKIRVVFDCSLKYQGLSLNDVLLQGPDLTNNLLGTLLRFRQDKVAFMGDIQKMFYQVQVPEHHRDFLRFFWYPDGDLDVEPAEYRVTVHIFGAVSSPSCANFVLRQTALTEESQLYSEEARRTISRNFYVDDLIKSLPTEERSIEILKEVKEIVALGGFKLLGFVSNSRLVLNSLPAEELAGNFKDLDLLCDELPYERALGVTWDVQEDAIGFKLNLAELPPTKRGVLSTVFSIYDPFGIACPAILPAKRIFQRACHEKLQWDDSLPEDLLKKWHIWLKNISLLKEYKISRCYKVNNDEGEIQLHTFCDGSEVAFGTVSYLRFSNGKQVHCSLVMAKSRLVPMGGSTLATIPRIELNAARLAVVVQRILREELELKIKREYFWTDSTTVLKYINCETKRFQKFVSNRVAFIREYSGPQDWHHVPGILNPADMASRGVPTQTFLDSEIWKNGPNFLWRDEEFWPRLIGQDQVSDDDPEIKKEKLVVSTKIELRGPTDVLLEASSSWYKTKLHVAWMLRVKHGLHLGEWKKSRMLTKELKEAESTIWRYVQRREYSEIFHRLENGSKLLLRDKLIKLHPFIDKNGLLRVGGRLEKAEEAYETKHPIILPGTWHVTRLLSENIHHEVGHLGRETVLSCLRQNYWVIGANSLIRKIVRECFACRKRQGRSSEQLMAEHPTERVVGEQPAFTNIGIDCFGPFAVIRGRGKEKRYGVIFTCLASRAVHIEVAFSLDTSSFINALRRFVSRRGFPKVIRSDNGTNFVGADKELRRSIQEWNCKQTADWLLQNEIEWKFQPPAASHFGGIWEREIRTIRKVLSGLTNEQPLHQNDEGLNTLMCEVENILNSRPLTELSSDPNDMGVITPNHLLLMHSGITYPPGLFNKDDLYTKKRWRQIQYLANLFWIRWRKEYLPLLQERQKWTLHKRSHQVGDLVLLIDQLLPRNQWSLGRIVKVFKDRHGHVRVADIKVTKNKEANWTDLKTTIVQRPVAKLILLRSFEEL